MNRLKRLIKHRLWDERDARQVLPQAALDRLQGRVASSERQHSGEIRLCIEAGLPLSYLWQRRSARDRAITLFGKLRVWDTEHNNGVLIYLLLAEQAIEIVADRGLAKQVPDATWQAILAPMRSAFRANRFEDGLNQAIDAIDALLSRHFALAPGERNANELPDRADMR